MQALEYDDLELWLTGWLRPQLTAWSPWVDRKFPGTDWTPGYAVVVRDDSGPDLSIVTAQRVAGVTVVGPEVSYQQTAQLAQRVSTLLRSVASSPVAACVAVRGPYSQPAVGRVEFYLTADLIVVGHSVTL